MLCVCAQVTYFGESILIYGGPRRSAGEFVMFLQLSRMSRVVEQDQTTGVNILRKNTLQN